MDIRINADDYGWSNSCSVATLKAFQKGYITTTTMCANGEAFDFAAEQIMLTEYKKNVGIHFVLTEGVPLTDAIKGNAKFCDAEGVYHGRINRYKYITSSEKNEIYEELMAQAEKVRRVGLEFHHADSHHHIHTAPFITPIVWAVMKEYGIKELRLHRNIGNIPCHKLILKQIYNTRLKQQKCAYSDFFGSFKDVEHCKNIFKKKGVLEIMCHPDLDKEGRLIDRSSEAMYDTPFGTELSWQHVLLGGMLKNA